MPKADLNKLGFSSRCRYIAFQSVRHIPIVKRLYPSLLKQWARLTWTGGYKVGAYRGFYLLLNYKNALDRKIGLHGAHEMAQSQYFFSNMQERGCDVFLDIGANIGTYSLFAAHNKLTKEIHAFEPDPRNFAQMQGNLYLNKFLDKIHAHNIALSEKAGVLRFEMGTDEKPDLTKVATGNGPTRDLMAKPLDEVLPYSGKKVFLKIDTEGHEGEVLRGATQFLKNNDCFLQIETWPENSERLTKDMQGFGYRCIHKIGNDHYFCK